MVVARIRLAVNHEKAFVASHARIPLAPATAVIAPIEHWVHMRMTLVLSSGRPAYFWADSK